MRPDARMRLRNMAVGVVASIGAVVVAAAMASACAGSESVDTSTTGSSQSTTGTGARGGAGGESSSTTTSATTGSGGKGGASASSGPGGNGGTAGSGVAGAGGETGGGGAGGDGGNGGSGGGCQATPEICNGLDDNCNNLVDEGDPGGGADCMAVALGECKKGKMHCVNGAPKCVAALPSPEVCDGLDNNCDGNVDEGNPGGGLQCMTGLMGLCSTGITMCSGMGGVICMPSVSPGQLPEACNGLDDDCDGLTDEAIAQVGQPCTAVGFSGICQFGTYSCPAQAPFQLTCNHPLPGTVPESCNGLDDDCNGTIDDPALLNNLPCTTAFPGVCAAGKTLCVGGSLQCNANIPPNTQTEICNSLDDNCNGQTDEMNPTPACTTQNPGASFVQTWACNAGQCAIVTCQTGHANINGAIGDGCECSTDQWANTCNNASSLSVPKAGNVTMTGKIETATGSDWVVFSFVPPAGPPALYHPQVQLSNNAGGQYAMDVQTNCGSPVSCNDGGGGNNLTIWEQNYNGYGTVPNDLTTKILSVHVRVYRKNGDAPTCDQYTVTATNP